MNIAIVGLGLIGGSIALDLRRKNIGTNIIGIDNNTNHCVEALQLNLVDAIENMENALIIADVFIVAIPVNFIPVILAKILDNSTKGQIVIDLGSTKENICRAVVDHPNRTNYLACHPIAGTENTGPSAAIENLFNGKVNIICDKQYSGEEALNVGLTIFNALGMRSVYMDSTEHDKHIAYVSHLSHISSFALGKTVLEIEESEKTIFNMAGSGFASTVRLAKSSPDMWSPIFDQNAENISKALGAYIDNLKQFKAFIDNKLINETHRVMTEVNEIKRVLKGIELNN